MPLHWHNLHRVSLSARTLDLYRNHGPLRKFMQRQLTLPLTCFKSSTGPLHTSLHSPLRSLTFNRSPCTAEPRSALALLAGSGYCKGNNKGILMNTAKTGWHASTTAEVANIAFGIWLALSPFVLGFSQNIGVTWNNICVGIALVLVAVAGWR